MRLARLLFVLCTPAAMVAAGCDKKFESAPLPSKTAVTSEGMPREAPSAPTATRGAPSMAPLTVRGRILERIDATPYSYVKIASPMGETWAAVPATSGKVGDEIVVTGQMTMENFESKTLKRTFEKLVFGTVGAADGARDTAATGAPSPSLPPGHPPVAEARHPMAVAAPASGAVEKIARAGGADGHTVAEVWAARLSLKDKPVAVRGKVVKYNPEVMGKNWVHVRDGSGSEAANDNDLTATTSDGVAIGDVVTVTGRVHLDRDFGAGYTYAVIIEDARVQK